MLLPSLQVLLQLVGHSEQFRTQFCSLITGYDYTCQEYATSEQQTTVLLLHHGFGWYLCEVGATDLLIVSMRQGALTAQRCLHQNAEMF